MSLAQELVELTADTDFYLTGIELLRSSRLAENLPEVFALARGRSKGYTPEQLSLENLPDLLLTLEGRTKQKCLRLSLSGVSEYTVTQPNVVFNYESIKIINDDPALFDYGELFSLFGSAPLPDPAWFLLEFVKFLRSELKTKRDPLDYLNWQTSFSEWLPLVYSRAYLLLTAPECIVFRAKALVENQAVDCSMLHAREAFSPKPKLLLELGSSWFVCQDVFLCKLPQELS